MLILSNGREIGLGWRGPSPQDDRDYPIKQARFRFPILNLFFRDKYALPARTNNRQFVPDLDRMNQLTIGSCTAHVGPGVMHFLTRKMTGKEVYFSRLFGYWLNRYYAEGKNPPLKDDGAYLRNMAQTLVVYGLPKEDAWPYDISQLNTEPPVRAYIEAQQYQATEYYRLDLAGVNREDLLTAIKTHVAAQVPVFFGVWLYNSFEQAVQPGAIPMPLKTDKLSGGHALWASDYDDDFVITDRRNNCKTVGALVCPNSWGTEWGYKGFAYIPYDYILAKAGLLSDVWAITKAEWLDEDRFSK